MVFLDESLGTFTSTSGDGMDATATLKMHQVSNKARLLLACQLTGQTVLDGAVKIKVGGKTAATIKTSVATNAIRADELLPVNFFIKPNDQITIEYCLAC